MGERTCVLCFTWLLLGLWYSPLKGCKKGVQMGLQSLGHQHWEGTAPRIHWSNFRGRTQSLVCIQKTVYSSMILTTLSLSHHAGCQGINWHWHIFIVLWGRLGSNADQSLLDLYIYIDIDSLFRTEWRQLHCAAIEISGPYSKAPCGSCRQVGLLQQERCSSPSQVCVKEHLCNGLVQQMYHWGSRVNSHWEPGRLILPGQTLSSPRMFSYWQTAPV